MPITLCLIAPAQAQYAPRYVLPNPPEPGTKVYALIPCGTYQDSQWKDDELSPLRESRRGLFFKASYLHRF